MTAVVEARTNHRPWSVSGVLAVLLAGAALLRPGPSAASSLCKLAPPRDRFREALTRVGPPPRPKAQLTPRESRMMRWHLLFTAKTGPDYLEQMRALGAILAFPVKEGDDPEYKVVRDLKPGGKLLDEDVTEIQRIYWIDDKERSVKDILAALGLKLKKTPSRFIVFMPEKLEAELFALEKRHVEKVLKAKFDEDKIEETTFRVVKTAKGPKVELSSVKMKK